MRAWRIAPDLRVIAMRRPNRNVRLPWRFRRVGGRDGIACSGPRHLLDSSRSYRGPSVSDDSAPTLPGLDHAWAALANQGYVLTHEKEIGLPGFRENFLNTYFTGSVLRHDPDDWPVDRERARDVVGYRWCDDQLHLREHDIITITDRADIPGKRDHSRVWLLDDPDAQKMIRTFLSLVPPERAVALTSIGWHQSVSDLHERSNQASSRQRGIRHTLR